MPDDPFDDLLADYNKPNKMPVYVPVLHVGDYVHAFNYDVYGVIVRINWQGCLVLTDENPPRFGGFGATELWTAPRTCWERLLGETQKNPFRFLSPVVYCCATCAFLEIRDMPSRQLTLCKFKMPPSDTKRDGWCKKWSEALAGVDRNYV